MYSVIEVSKGVYGIVATFEVPGGVPIKGTYGYRTSAEKKIQRLELADAKRAAKGV